MFSSTAKDGGFLSVPKRRNPYFGNEHGYQNGLLMYFRYLFLLHILSYDNFNTQLCKQGSEIISFLNSRQKVK